MSWYIDFKTHFFLCPHPLQCYLVAPTIKLWDLLSTL